MITVTFLPQNINQPAERGERLLEIAAKAGVLIDGNCGGSGKCGKCRVKIASGAVLPPDEEEKAILTRAEIRDGYRLACRLIAEDDICVILPEVKHTVSSKAEAAFLPESFKHKPYIHKYLIDAKPAGFDYQKGDAERILSCLGDDVYRISPVILPVIPDLLSRNKKITAVVRENEIISLEAGDSTSSCFGIAFDIGTTTVAAMLWDLNEGKFIGASAVTNPQSIFGADVISRISYCAKDENNTAVMQGKIIDCFNDIIEGFKSDYNIKSDEIYEICVAGNTTMSHLFLGVNPKQLARAPFAPVFCNNADIAARELRLKVNPTANVHLLPNIAGHIGSDITGGLLAVGITGKEGLQIFVDIGTNGEIAAAKNGRVLACSAAAGPAFEGAAIHQGMRAAAGAIESMMIENGKVILKVVDDREPAGICGSGLIDAIAQMLNHGIVDNTGKIISRDSAIERNLPSDIVSRLRVGENGKEFVLAFKQNAPDVVLTQKDIRQVQLAKGAICAGIRILIKKIGASIDDIDCITIAGAFGNSINPESALRIGLLPDIEADRICFAGNAAGIGASVALLSLEERIKAQREAANAEHVELASCEDFQSEYVMAMNFPEISEKGKKRI